MFSLLPDTPSVLWLSPDVLVLAGLVTIFCTLLLGFLTMLVVESPVWNFGVSFVLSLILCYFGARVLTTNLGYAIDSFGQYKIVSVNTYGQVRLAEDIRCDSYAAAVDWLESQLRRLPQLRSSALSLVITVGRERNITFNYAHSRMSFVCPGGLQLTVGAEHRIQNEVISPTTEPKASQIK